MSTETEGAVGHIVFRPTDDGIVGAAKLHGIKLKVRGYQAGDKVYFHGDGLRGELNRERGRDDRFGKMQMGRIVYEFSGEWDEDEEGQVLKCVVTTE